MRVFKFFLIVLLLIFKLGAILSSDNKTGDQQLKLSRTPDFCKENFSEVDCEKLSPDCLHCSYVKSCVYGNTTIGKCTVPAGISCKVQFFDNVFRANLERTNVHWKYFYLHIRFAIIF